MEVTKGEVEELLKYEVSEALFLEALAYAKKKQKHSYEKEKQAVIMQHWYLVMLIKDCVNALAFSKYTMDLCDKLNNMEKECPVQDQNTLTLSHIVPQPIA